MAYRSGPNQLGQLFRICTQAKHVQMWNCSLMNNFSKKLWIGLLSRVCSTVAYSNGVHVILQWMPGFSYCRAYVLFLPFQLVFRFLLNVLFNPTETRPRQTHFK